MEVAGNLRVSVIIPTYNRPTHLKRAIDSVLNQTYSNIEIIIVDDNNPKTEARKQTEIIMQDYNSEKMIYIKHEKNKNGAAARNTGIKQSTGEIICFLDDDDYYLPEKIEKQVNFLIKTENYQGVYCGRIQNGKYVKPKKSGDLTLDILTLKFTPTTPSLMFYKNVVEEIGGFNESFKRHQDFEFLLKFFQKFKLGFIEEALVVIGVNMGENALHGKELEQLKSNFFNSFRNVINNLDKKDRKNIYCSHYSQVFWDHIDELFLFLAIRILIVNLIKYPLTFMKYNIEYLVKYFITKISRLISKNEKKIRC